MIAICQAPSQPAKRLPEFMPFKSAALADRSPPQLLAAGAWGGLKTDPAVRLWEANLSIPKQFNHLQTNQSLAKARVFDFSDLLYSLLIGQAKPLHDEHRIKRQPHRLCRSVSRRAELGGGGHMFLQALPMASARRTAPSGYRGPMCHQKAHETPRYRAGHYGVFGTSGAINSYSNHELLR
jgi:hypothetical protein